MNDICSGCGDEPHPMVPCEEAAALRGTKTSDAVLKILVTTHAMGWRIMTWRDALKISNTWTAEDDAEEAEYSCTKELNDSLVCVSNDGYDQCDYEDYDPESGPSWEPLTLIEHAFKVVDAMKNKGFSFSLWMTMPLSSVSNGACAAFKHGVYPPSRTEMQSMDPSPAKAICLAALVALGVYPPEPT